MKYFYTKVRKTGLQSSFLTTISAKKLPVMLKNKHLKDSLVIIHFQKSALD